MQGNTPCEKEDKQKCQGIAELDVLLTICLFDNRQRLFH